MLIASLLLSVALAGVDDCNGDAIPDDAQPCLDCDDNGLLDSCEAAAFGGLVGQYWFSEGGFGGYSERLAVRIDETIDFNWGDGSPDPRVPADDFSVRWTGTLTPSATGTYQFITTTDDGVRLWVDGVLLIDQWVRQPPTERTASLVLEAGVPVLIRMDYFEAGGGAVARLEWTPPGGERGVIPVTALHPSTDLDGDGWPDSCGDCNGNGIADAQDLLDGTSFDCNGNCVPDECDVTEVIPLVYWRFVAAPGRALVWGPTVFLGGAVPAEPIDDVAVDSIPQTVADNTLGLQLGGDGYVIVPDPDDRLSAGGASFTIEAWVRLDQLSNTSGSNQRQFLVQKKELVSPGSQSDYSFLVQGGNLQQSVGENFGKTGSFSGRELVVLLGDGSGTWSVTSSLEIDDFAWHHVSVAYDAGTGEFRFGLDGEFETILVPGQGFTTNGGPLLIGAHTSASGVYNQFLRGAVDEVRITAEALSIDRLLRSFASADCNGNGFPDSCDIASGISRDCDRNGRPDECDPDCNGNGIPDACDIAAGTSRDCNANLVPDECELGEDDCDGSGIPDDCELEGNDCNGNGVLDSCDLASGTSDDCDGDGVPDDCQLEQSLQLGYDDGAPELGVRTFEPNMVWLNRFQAPAGASVVESVDVIFVFIPIGTEMGMYVWSDPDADGDPTDAQVLWSGSVVVQATNVVTRIPVPDVAVGSAGAGFFIGFSAAVTEADFPAAMDISGQPAPGRSWLIGSESAIDPDDLSEGVIEFRPIERILGFDGNWSLRANMRLAGRDCNGNGITDGCDIASGISVDIDGNGVPDECEDCNANGVVDGFEIAGGTSLDCNADGVPDECQLAANDCDGDGVPDLCQIGGNDCNDNGIPDPCDLASGTSEDEDGNGIPDECEDCNGNGILDGFDVLGGLSEDCNGDQIPDECQYGQPLEPVSYAYDDGTSEANLGVTAPVDFVWLNRFIVQPGGEWITAIEVAWANTFAGVPSQVVLWEDPNDDGNPSDASVIIVVGTETANVNSSTFNTVAIPPTWVGAPGRSFFAGVRYDDVFNTAPIPLDQNGDGDGQSWLGWTVNQPIDLNNLPGAGIYQFSADDFLLRVVGGDGSLEADCNANLVLDGCDIAGGDSDDANGNGTPDECECIGDIDGDGTVAFGDLLGVLSAWGGCMQCPEDLDGSGDVGFNDLLLLLAAWGSCS